MPILEKRRKDRRSSSLPNVFVEGTMLSAAFLQYLLASYVGNGPRIYRTSCLYIAHGSVVS